MPSVIDRIGASASGLGPALQGMMRQALTLFSTGNSGTDPATIFVPGGNQNPPTRLARQFLEQYSHMPWLRAVVNRISTSVAQTQWQIFIARSTGTRNRMRSMGSTDYRDRRKELLRLKQAGDLTEITDHPILDLLDTGNRFFLGMSTRILTQIYLEILGEAFWIKQRDNAGRVAALWPVPPTWIMDTPTPDKPFFKANFRGFQGEIPMTEVVWMMHPDPANPYGRGVGYMQALADELEIDEYVAKFTKTFFFNGARPDMIITMEGAKKEDRDRAEQNWQARLQGFWKAYRPFFTSKKMDVEFIQQDLSHIRLTELRVHERNTIMQVTGIPPEILGVIENSNRSTIEASDFLYSKWVVEPRLEFQRCILQEDLVPEFDERLIIDFVSPVKEDKEFHLKAAQAAPWSRTVNEWRDLQDLEPIADGSGEVFMVPFNLTPTAAINQPAGLLGTGQRGVAHDPGANVIRSLGDPEFQCLDLLTHDSADPFVRAHHELISPFCRTHYYVDSIRPTADLSVFRQGGEPSIGGPLGDLFLAMHDVADKFRDQVLGIFTGSVEEVRANIDRELLRNGLATGNRGMINEALPVEILQNMEGFIADASLNEIALAGSVSSDILEAVTGFQVQFDPRSEHIQRVATTMAGELVTQITDRQRSDLQDVLTRILGGDRSTDQSAQLIGDMVGLTDRQMATLLTFETNLRAQGRPESEIGSRVSNLSRAMRRRRGEVIARTETINTANAGQMETWRQAVDQSLINPQTATRVWIVTDDDRLDTRICEPMDGQVVGLFEDFTTGDGRKVPFPTAHPQCRCAVALRVNRLADLQPPIIAVTV